MKRRNTLPALQAIWVNLNMLNVTVSLANLFLSFRSKACICSIFHACSIDTDMLLSEEPGTNAIVIAQEMVKSQNLIL